MINNLFFINEKSSIEIFCNLFVFLEVTDNSSDELFMYQRQMSSLCFKIPFSILTDNYKLIQKTCTSNHSTEASLYWQKAADTMLWKKGECSYG